MFTICSDAVILTNTKNKVQLNAMLAEGLLNSDYYTNATQYHTYSCWYK